MNLEHPVLDVICLWAASCTRMTLFCCRNDLQSMLNVCDVSSQLLLKFNSNKCIAFGKMTKSAMSGDGLQLDNGVVMWFDTIEYLGIHF